MSINKQIRWSIWAACCPLKRSDLPSKGNGSCRYIFHEKVTRALFLPFIGISLKFSIKSKFPACAHYFTKYHSLFNLKKKIAKYCNVLNGTRITNIPVPVIVREKHIHCVTERKKDAAKRLASVRRISLVKNSTVNSLEKKCERKSILFSTDYSSVNANQTEKTFGRYVFSNDTKRKNSRIQVLARGGGGGVGYIIIWLYTVFNRFQKLAFWKRS